MSGVGRGLAGCIIIGLVVMVIRATAPTDSSTALMPARSEPAVKSVPDGPSIPHAFTVVPRGYDRPAAEKLAAADAMIARWAKWKARPQAEVIPFSDYRVARMNLTTIRETDPEYEAAMKKAAELDSFGTALANEEIKVAEKIRTQERVRVEQARANDTPGRKAFARALEERYLRKSMDAKVSSEGDRGSVLRIKYIGFSRPAVFQMQESGAVSELIDQAREKGFRKLILYDGYNYSWTWEIKAASG